MAVAPIYRGKGIGGELLLILEQHACDWQCQEIVLNARSDILKFYLHHNYSIIGDAPMLFGAIAHKYMRKKL